MAEETFSTVGTHTWTVPDGVDEVNATLLGASGDPGQAASAGLGGETVATLPVTAGEELEIFVGGAASGSSGGFNGGADTGDNNAGGGGGASDIRQTGATLSDRVLVAGGGAGSGEGAEPGVGGDGGGLEGGSGTDSPDADGGDGGGGGTQTSGGAGGDARGDGGTFGDGGAPGTSFEAGGGGGGGWYGGGGGGRPSTSDGDGGGGGGGGSSYIDDVANGTTSAGVNTGDGEVTLEYDVEIDSVEDLSVINDRDTELDLEWTDPDTGVDEQHLYRATEPGVDTTDTLVDTFGPNTGTYTDTLLDNGTTYYYLLELVQTDPDDKSELSNETNGQTTIPPIEELGAAADQLAELAVSWETDQNTGDIRVEYRETGASTWTGHDLLPFSARDSTIAELLDGQAYDVRVRGETSGTTGAWSEASETTLLPALNIQFPHVTRDSIEIDWSEPNNPDTTYVLERADADDVRDPDPTFSAFATIAETAPTVLDEDVSESERFRYRVTADTGDATATDEGGVQADFTFSDNYTAELVLDDGEESATIPIESRDWIEPPGNWRREPSAITTWEGTIPYSTGAENWTRADAYIYFGGELLLSGELLVATSQDSAGETRLEGDDVVIKLTRGGAIDDFQNVEAHTAIEQYAAKHLDDWTVNVEAPEEEPVDEGLVVQRVEDPDEFSTVFSEALDGDSTTPAVAVPSGIEVGRTNILLSTTQDPISGSSTLIAGDQFSTGFARLFEDNGDDLEMGDIELNYTIPENAVGIAVRWELFDDPVPLEITLVGDGSSVGSVVADPNGVTPDVAWDFSAEERLPIVVDEWDDGDIPPGEYRIEVEATTGSSEVGSALDFVSIYDQRYHTTDEFDNELHEPEGHLDGPSTHPNPDIGADIASDAFGQAFNIQSATVTTTIDDVSGSQRLQASNDDGQTWLPTDGAETNTQTVTADFSGGDSFGTIAQGRVRLNAWSPDGTRNNTTPRENYAGQRLESWELAIDTNNIAALDDFEVAGNHFENLQDLCNEAGMVFVPEYKRDELRLDVFVPGQLTQTADWTRLDFERELDVRSYANRVRVIGARDEETGERIEATAESQPEIDRVGTVVDAPPIVEDDVESEERLRNIARRELSKRVAEDRLGGSVDIVPKPLRPGFAYEVDALDGLEIPLRGVEFRDTREPTGTLEFREPDDLAAAIAGIRTSIRRS